MHFLRMTILTSFIIFSAAVAMAQGKLLKGVVFEQGSALRIGDVTVKNLSTNARVKTTYMGEFSIQASIGDTLFFSHPEYADYKLPVKSYKDMVIQLIRSRRLAEVVITAPTKKEELDEVLDDYRKKGSYYRGKPPVLTYIFKPLTALYELIGKTPRQAKRFYNYYGTELEQSEIDRRFNAPFVRSVTDLPDKDLENFMRIYRPAYQKLSKWNEYDLMNYVATSLKAFNDNGRPVAPELPDLRDIPVSGKSK